MRPQSILSMIVLALLTAIGCAASEKPDAPKKDPAPAQPKAGPKDGGADRLPALKDVDPAVVRWLDKLEEAHSQIQTLQATVRFTKENALLGEKTERNGQVSYATAQEAKGQDEPENPHRFAIDFKNMIVNRALRKVRLQYIFDGQWLAEADHGRKFFMRRQVVAPGEKLNPLQLDGPFPVPIGQKRQAVLSRFKVKIVPPTEDETTVAKKAGTEPPLHLNMLPKPQKAKQKNQAEFKTVDLWFDRQTLLPIRVETTTDQHATRVRIANAKINQLKAEEAKTIFDTKPPKNGAGWRVQIQKLKP